MEDQHPTEECKHKLEAVLDSIMKSVTNLQMDTAKIVKEVNNVKETVDSFLSRTSKSNEQGVTESTCTKSNDSDLNTNAQPNAGIHNDPEESKNPEKAQQIPNGDGENTVLQVVPSKASTAKMAIISVKAMETIKEEKMKIPNVDGENTDLQIPNGAGEYTDLQNGVTGFKGFLQVKLDMLKQSFETGLENLRCDMEKRFQGLERGTDFLIENVETIMASIMEKKKKCESKSYVLESLYFWKKQEVVCHMYCPKPSDMVSSVTEELSLQLTKHLSTHGITLKMQICKSVKDIKNDVLLILICLNTSRIGTDVSNAIKGIQTGPNVAVLILHHADSHALPTQSTKHILTAPEYKKINTMIDMGFLLGKGIYDCSMNDKALKDLISFLKG